MVDLPHASFRDDVILTTDANNALAMTVRVPGQVEASASEGDVWLTGTAGNRFERDAAEQAIAVLSGVRGIDEIEIFGDIEAANVANVVQGALDRYGVLPFDNDVRVQADDGTITFTGSVGSCGQDDAVIDAAWRGVGVRNVRDDLAVTA
jgi:osmotically-inducible protein OsmY